MKLRYVELEPSRIFNWLGPENVTAFHHAKLWKDKWWEPEIIELRTEFARIWIEEFDKITNHFSLLEDAIQKNGIKRPVSAVSGPMRNVRLDKVKHGFVRFYPPEYQSRIDEVIYTQPFGGSRVTIAQKNGFKVPCVVHDFSNLFPDAPRVTKDNFRKWFGSDYSFSNALPHIRIRQHSHIKKGRYRQMNGDTRNAQKTAARRTKERMGIR